MMERAAGIFAAGEGARLRERAALKPLADVAGRPLVHWVAASLAATGCRRITVLLNSRGGPVRDYLPGAFPAVAWTFRTADPPTSWASFRLLAKDLAKRETAFLLSTVDALVPPAEASRFAAECGVLADRPRFDAALALTRFVDDEKPLWAELGPDGRVAALGPAARRDTVTCGLYALRREAARSMPGPDAFGSLREFWTDAAARLRVGGIVLAKTLDVDRPEDLAPAGDFAQAGWPAVVIPTRRAAPITPGAAWRTR